MNMLDRAMDAARRSPEGTLLLAAGCALLMRGVNAAAGRMRAGSAHLDMDHRDTDPRDTSYSGHAWHDAGRHARNGAGHGGEDAHGLIHSAQAYASDVGGRMADKAEAATGRAVDAGRVAVARAGEAAREVRTGTSDAVGRIVDEQPLVVGLVGIVAGVLIAAALPGSRMERQAFAPVGRRLGETALEARRRLTRATERSRDRAVEMAEEHGLTRQGLREAVTNVAETFSGEMMASAGPAPNSPSKTAAAATGKVKRAANAAGKKAAKATKAKPAVIVQDAADATSSTGATTTKAGDE